jgi:hypothetical protein
MGGGYGDGLINLLAADRDGVTVERGFEFERSMDEFDASAVLAAGLT